MESTRHEPKSTPRKPAPETQAARNSVLKSASASSLAAPSHETRPASAPSHETRPASSHETRPASSHETRPASAPSHETRPASSHETRPAPRKPAPPPRLPEKVSAGIILCRRGERPEALLVQKRCTYAFSEFIHGHYVGSRYGLANSLSSVAPLLAAMTADELLDILTLNFAHMWYRNWLTQENQDLYNKKHAKFQTTFISEDGGAGLRDLVRRTRTRGARLWEVPKGRHTSPRETDIACAMRELREETGIEKGDYYFLPGARRRVSYVSNGTRYTCIYYVALAHPHLARGRWPGGADPGRPILRPLTQMSEVSDIRWYGIEQIRLVDVPERYLESLVKPAFALMRQYLRGRWDARQPRPPSPTTPFVPPRGAWARGRSGGAAAQVK